MRLACCLALAFAPHAAAAQDEYDHTRALMTEVMNGCLAQSLDRRGDGECGALVSNVCAAIGPGAGTTYGYNSCSGIGLDLWDAELNRLWPEALAAAPDAEGLRAKQRAWIAARDARCDAEAGAEGGGSMATWTYNFCALDLTIDRVADFRDLVGR